MKWFTAFFICVIFGVSIGMYYLIIRALLKYIGS